MNNEKLNNVLPTAQKSLSPVLSTAMGNTEISISDIPIAKTVDVVFSNLNESMDTSKQVES